MLLHQSPGIGIVVVDDNKQEDMHQIIRILPKERQTMLFSATQVGGGGNGRRRRRRRGSFCFCFVQS